MRHQKAGNKFNRTGSHRNAMFRNMVTSLFTYGKIRTTDAKAKELRRWADRIITLAKRGDLHARRQALAIVRSKGVVHKLFEEAAERFGNRSGGYTRIIKIGRRTGDSAPISLIEFVGPEEKKKKKKTKTSKKVAPQTKKESAAKSKAKAKDEPEKKQTKDEEAASESAIDDTPKKKTTPKKKADPKKKVTPKKKVAKKKTEAAAEKKTAKTKKKANTEKAPETSTETEDLKETKAPSKEEEEEK